RTWGARCQHCYRVDEQKIERWIAEALADPQPRGRLHRVALNNGFSKNSTHQLMRKIHQYLVLTKQDDLIAQFWPNGIPPWLQKACAAVLCDRQYRPAAAGTRPRLRRPQFGPRFHAVFTRTFVQWLVEGHQFAMVEPAPSCRVIAFTKGKTRIEITNP